MKIKKREITIDNKVDLSKAIEEGVMNGVWKPISYLLISFVVVMIIFISVNSYLNWKCTREDTCLEMESLPLEDNCPFDWVECSVIDRDIENRMMADNPVGVGARPIIMMGVFCGYQEANAWFEQYKNKIGGNLYLDCN